MRSAGWANLRSQSSSRRTRFQFFLKSVGHFDYTRHVEWVGLFHSWAPFLKSGSSGGFGRLAAEAALRYSPRKLVSAWLSNKSWTPAGAGAGAKALAGCEPCSVWAHSSRHRASSQSFSAAREGKSGMGCQNRWRASWTFFSICPFSHPEAGLQNSASNNRSRRFGFAAS
jgi:hypothetical protein